MHWSSVAAVLLGGDHITLDSDTSNGTGTRVPTWKHVTTGMTSCSNRKGGQTMQPDLRNGRPRRGEI